MTLSKKIVASYLDNKCDRRLFLSIMNRGGSKELPSDERQRLEIPNQYKHRTRGLQISEVEGRILEEEYYIALKNRFMDQVRWCGKKKYLLSDALSDLPGSISAPEFLVETTYSIKPFYNDFLAQAQVQTDDLPVIPGFSDLRPDIIVAMDKANYSRQEENAYEILPNGQLSLTEKNDNRTALMLVDIKSTEDADISQFVEVALYAWTLSNWLHFQNLDTNFFVVDTIGIWTRNSEIMETSTNVEEGFSNWYQSLSLSTFDQYMLPLQKFFSSDVPRVMMSNNWKDLEYHLTPSCDMCDFLGRLDRNEKIYKSEQKFVNELCAHKALQDEHISRVPGLTKGARRTLAASEVVKIVDLYGCEESVFDQHTELKKQKGKIPERARAVQERLPAAFFSCKDFSLAKSMNLGIMFNINYDMSIGLAASFSLQGYALDWHPDGFHKNAKFHTFPQKTFLVEKNSVSEELDQLQAFLASIEEMIAFACSEEFNTHEDYNKTNISTRPTIQFYCWDSYQLIFMKKILARHLQVLLDERFSRSLLWLFSPDELLQHPGFFRLSRKHKLMAPYICLIKNIIAGHGRFPLETTYPLMPVAANLDEDFKNAVKYVSPLHKAQFGDYIPRERILEIWYKKAANSELTEAQNDPINQGKTEDELKNNIIERYKKEYGSVCKKQIWALSVLRKYVARNKSISNIAYAPPIIFESILDNYNIKKLPADSQLWCLYALLDDQLNMLQYQQDVSADLTLIEARYDCVITTNKLNTNDTKRLNVSPSTRFSELYFVTEDSKNCKIREGDGYLTLLHTEYLGFPFMRPIDFLNQGGASDQEIRNLITKYPGQIFQPFYKLVSATLIRFDRIQGWAEIALNLGVGQTIVGYLLSEGYLSFGERLAIGQGKPLNRHHIVENCLKAIGHPEGIQSSDTSLSALLKETADKSIKTHSLSRGAEVLWLPNTLRKSSNKLSPKNQETITNVSALSGRSLPNDSQKIAIDDAIENSLSVIWGPPGTGKTDTAINIIGVKLLDALREGRTQRILITGPTKRAVIEILNRLQPVLASLDQKLLTLICLAGTGSRDYDFIMDNTSDWSAINRRMSCHGTGKRIQKSKGVDEEFENISQVREFIKGSQTTSRIIVVATHYHLLYPLMTGISVIKNYKDRIGDARCELFDHALVDESSQIDVPNSIAIVNTLARDGSITFVGDHLQMLPIQTAPLPKGSENLLSSVQQYLINNFNFDKKTLLENYRSVKEIVDFGRRIGYPAGLQAKSGTSYAKISRTSFRKALDFSYRMEDELALELLGWERPTISIRYRDGMSGQANFFEVMIAVNMIVAYFERVQNEQQENDFIQYFWQKMVGVVTPHKAQRALMVRELFQVFPESHHAFIDEAVDTVERFQGGERNFIIVSYGVGDEDVIRQEEGFLINLNRTNVAISRAKQKVVVMMSDELATHLTNDEELIPHAKAIKRFDHYCSLEQHVDVPYLDGERQLNYRYLTGSLST